MKTCLQNLFIALGLWLTAPQLHAQGTTATAIAAGTYHSLFLKSDGSLWAMGDNRHGQLGDGSYNPTNQPELIVAGDVTAIAAGSAHSLFLKSDGSLWAMGGNQWGQLGDGTTNDINLPEQIVAGNVTAIAGGGQHSLFLKSDGSLWAMGDNAFGQLGGAPGGASLPEMILSSNVTAITAGNLHSLFLKNDGRLWGMGLNNLGQLGDGTYNNHSAPEMIEDGDHSEVTTLAPAGVADHTLFIDSAGILWDTGWNEFGQLGVGTDNNSNVPLGITSDVTAAAAGGEHSLFLKRDGSLWAMGNDYFGQLGNGDYNTDILLPEQIVPHNVTAIAAGYGHSLFLKGDGSLWAMGDNQYGQLGDGTTDNGTYENSLPEQIFPIVTTVLFTATPTSGVEPLTVQFTSPDLDNSNNIIVAWNWNFGDGSISTAQNPSHTYTTNNVFYPTLVGTNNNGLTVVGSGPPITVTPAPPAVFFAPLTNLQVVPDLSGLGGFVSANFGPGTAVSFSILEVDINGGPGRWWNGADFQSASNALPAAFSGTNWSPAPGLLFPDLNSGQGYLLAVTAANSTNQASANITVQAPISVLNWDPGQTPLGTMRLQNPNTNGGNYWFQISTTNPAVGVWRTALNVLAGQATVYLSQGSPPTFATATYASTNAGSNGFVVDSSLFNAGDTWYILVNASPNSRWTLMSGDVYVYNLGSLAADNSSSTNAAIGAEGMIFYQTTIPPTTLAWQLWLNGSDNPIYVQKSSAPDAIAHDLIQTGQMLVVPPYLAGGTYNGFYFISVPGNPGTTIKLDSRQQPVTPLNFNTLTNVTVGANSFPYVTYQVQVPVQQIAWQLNLTPASGLSSIAARLAAVPNEFNNDAFSDLGGGVGNSITLVPAPPGSASGSPGLSAGTYYVTVYGTGSFNCGFTNGNPIITPVTNFFNFTNNAVTNDAPGRAGWRFYSVTDINSQLGYLGWQLVLSNAPAGSEIAIQTNDVPGQWNYRDQNITYTTPPYNNQSSVNGVLQQPGHQAEIWYIGVYSPTQALMNFVLAGQPLLARPASFDGSGSSQSVTNQPPGEWQYYRVVVPPDPNLLGWDVRLTDVTAGNPQLVVSREALPTGLGTTAGSCWIASYCGGAYPFSPNEGDQWPGGYQWQGGADWTGDALNPDGSSADMSMLEMGMGNPLQPGTYYLGVYDPTYTSGYTLLSRGIGTHYSIPVVALDWTNGAAANTLAPREAAYYSVVIPSNAPSWRVRLAPTTGDALLLVQENLLPNVDASLSGSASGFGIKIERTGNEYYMLLPQYNNSSVLPAGTNYLAVVGEGVNSQPNSEIGTNATSYVLESLGPLPVINLGVAGTNQLAVTNLLLEGGDVAAYQFTLPPGLGSSVERVDMTVSLTNVTAGSPVYELELGTNVPGALLAGVDGGDTATWSGSSNDIVNPTPGVYTVAVQSPTNDTAYTLQIQLKFTGPAPLGFDGTNNRASVTNQPPGEWQYYRVVVPPDPNLLGWDVRLTDVTAGNPQLVVSREALPTGLGTTAGSCWIASYCGGAYPFSPNEGDQWPGGYQWQGGADWTGDALNPDGSSADMSMLEMGMGNPLQPGTYYLGVYDPTYTSGYTLLSRGIGTHYSIPVVALDWTNGAAANTLAPREAAYYSVVIPSNAPSWRVRLAPTTGDALLLVQENLLPNVDASPSGSASGYGIKIERTGNEYYTLLPQYYNSNMIPAGTYYLAVVSEGVNSQPNSEIGSNATSYVLQSLGPLLLTNLGTVRALDLQATNALLEGGDLAAYQFTTLPGTMGIEVQLENQVGTPMMAVSSNPDIPNNQFFGVEGGAAFGWSSANLITIPNPAPGVYTVALAATKEPNGLYPDSAFVLVVHQINPPNLNLSSLLNTNGGANVVGGTLSDTASAFFQVNVPANVDGAPILGWNLALSETSGSPSVRVRRNLLPDNTCDTTAFAFGSIVIAPPYLTPGTWYVEVNASGGTAFTLTSSVITTNTLARSPWVMPATGETNTAPGLGMPVFGDTGVDKDGLPLPGDQGVDLAEGQYDFYAIVVPTNNAGLLRTELQALSGEPNLYIRAGAAPTANHDASGSCDITSLIDRQLTGSGTKYGNWVPFNGQTATNLTPGLWVLSVYASGSANTRYRLQLSCGAVAANGLVQSLPLDGGTNYTDQRLAGGDWRYYRVEIPANAPNNWVITWTRSQGSAHLFVRDTVPPGDGAYSDQDYNVLPTQAVTWFTDKKNEGPYPDFAAPGSDSLTTPPLRPGSTYYLGFWSPDDSTFSVACATDGGVIDATNIIAFTGGSIVGNIPGYGTLQYHMDVPAQATRIMFQATNSTDLVFSLDQGTVALAGGPAPWTSYAGNNSLNGNQANANLNELLTIPETWPWLPGYSYYLTITNTSSSAEDFSVAMSLPADLAPFAFTAPTTVTSITPDPTVQIVWGVTNQGPGSALGGWDDAVWFSTNGVLDAQSINLGNFPINQTVPANGSYWQTNSVTLPMIATGNYTLFLQVDVNDSIDEANLDDKVSPGVSGTFTLLTPPSFNVSPASLHWTRGGLEMELDNLSGAAVVIFASTNLRVWTPIYTNPPATGSIQFLDSTATNFSSRFYRAEVFR